MVINYNSDFKSQLKANGYSKAYCAKLTKINPHLEIFYGFKLLIIVENSIVYAIIREQFDKLRDAEYVLPVPKTVCELQFLLLQLLNIRNKQAYATQYPKFKSKVNYN